MQAQSVSSRSSRSSRASRYSSVSHSSDGSTTHTVTRRLPDTTAIRWMKYFTGRDPRRVTHVRVAETTYPYDYDDGASLFSWNGRRHVDIYLLERSRPYFEYEVDEITIRERRTMQSRASRRSGGGGDPWVRGQSHPARVDDEEDDDDDESEMSDEGFPQGHGPMPPPPPHMMPGHMPGHMPGQMPMHAPPGAFQAFHPGGGGPGPRPGPPPGAAGFLPPPGPGRPPNGFPFANGGPPPQVRG